MEFITGKAISRRTVLRGAGAALALPFLDAMLPSRLSAFGSPRRDGIPPHRFVAYYTPNGQAMEYWTPKGVGRDFELSEILQPLEAFKDDLIIPTGLQASWNFNHAGGPTCFLTGMTGASLNDDVRPDNTSLLAETSMDQILARRFENETQLGSLELSLDGPPNAGTCAILNCAYTHSFSWRSPTQPLPMENHPRTVFERLFGDSGSTDRLARERRLVQQKSLLDSVTDKLRKLQRELGVEDQRNLEQYTESVRDVERRIGLAEEQLDVDLPMVSQPQGIPNELEDHLELLLDLQLLALQGDVTRVSTMMIGREVNARPYPQIGVPEAWHPLSHHQNRPDLIARLSIINRHHVELFSRYLTKLRDTPDGDGSLYDHTTLLYGSGISNSQQHAGNNLPILLAGGGNGRLSGGQHLVFEDEPSHANLLHTLMDKFDVPVESVGGSTGPLPLDVDTLGGI
jgi:hypothetical protein